MFNENGNDIRRNDVGDPGNNFNARTGEGGLSDRNMDRRDPSAVSDNENSVFPSPISNGTGTPANNGNSINDSGSSNGNGNGNGNRDRDRDENKSENVNINQSRNENRNETGNRNRSGNSGDIDYNEGGYGQENGVGDGETNGGNENYTGTGYLTVAVRAADNAIPLEGALVTLRQGTDSSGGGDGIASFYTDRSGLTPRIFLSTPPRSNSDAPGGPRAYATYSVEVSLPGYYSNVYTDIPVFDGITSVQTAILIPLPEDGAGGDSVPDNIISFGGGLDQGPDGGVV